jgi:putative inorganic carbon (HCO3(-)) transporter
MTRDKTVIILDRYIEYLLYVMLAFIPVSIAAIEITFTLAIFAFLFKKALKPDFRFAKNLTHLFLLLFWGFCAVSLFNSGIYFTKSLWALFFKWGEYIFIFLIVEDTLNNPRRLRNAVFILLTVSALIGLDGLIQQFRGIDFFWQRVLVGGRITATFKNQNNFAAYLVPVLLMVTSLVFSPQLKKQYKWILLFLGTLLSICLVLTFSRGAWLGFFAGLVLIPFLFPNVKKAIPFICIFIVILILIPALRERASYTFQSGGDADRFALWQSAWAMIRENPYLGKGLGTFMDYFSRYATIKGVYYAHNCFLQIWAETGIFALLSFLLFVGSVLYKGISSVRKNLLTGQLSAVLAGFICAIFGFLIHSLFDVQLYSLQLAALFWFILGLAISTQRIERTTLV